MIETKEKNCVYIFYFFLSFVGGETAIFRFIPRYVLCTMSSGMLGSLTIL